MQRTAPNELRTSAILAVASLLFVGACTVEAAAPEGKPKTEIRSADASAALDLPLSFEPNRGQTDERARFIARGPGYVLLLTEAGSSFRFSQTAAGSGLSTNAPLFEMRLARPKKPDSQLLGLEVQPSKSSYFVGADPKKWLTEIPNYARVAQQNVYAGIDVTYSALQGQFECVFKIAPHAEPGSIALEMLGAQNLHKSSDGDLIFTVANVEMRLHKPFAYQEIKGSVNQPISSRYVVRNNVVSFAVRKYDSRKTLFIDPILSYSDYLKLQEAGSVPASQKALQVCPPDSRGKTRWRFARKPSPSTHSLFPALAHPELT
jgi:hypothetical protein